MHKKAVKIMKVKWGLLSNEKKLLPPLPGKLRQESLLTDFHRVKEIPFKGGMDACLEIINRPRAGVSVDVGPEKITVRGDVVKLEKTCRDRRYSLFGNEGLLFRKTLKILEDKYGIFSFHACALYRKSKNTLFLICGSAGSGKTCFILNGIESGLRLFSAEMAHFAITAGKIEFYKGALVDNVRIGNLKNDYPRLRKKAAVRLPRTDDIWGKKIPVDLAKFQTVKDRLLDPAVVIVLPRIEEGRKERFFRRENDRIKATRFLFENAGEKIGQSVLLYENVPAVCLDDPPAARRRARAIRTLLAHKKVKSIVNVVGGPGDCWKGLL